MGRKNTRRGLWALAALGVGLLAFQAFAEDPQFLKTRADKESYGTGVTIVRDLKKQGGAFNLDLVIQGMKDGLTGDKLLLSEKELRKVMEALEAEMLQKKKQAAAKHDGTGASAPGNAANAAAGPGDRGAGEKGKESPAQPAEDDGGGQLASTQGAAIMMTMNAATGNQAGAGQRSGEQQPQRIEQTGATEPSGLRPPSEAGMSRRQQAVKRLEEIKAMYAP